MGFSLKNNAITNYLRDAREEMHKVVWPSRKTVIRDTIIVIGISVAVGVLFSALDFGFNAGLQKLVELR